MSMKRTLAHAATGVLATGAGMAAGHLVASLLNPAASPVLAVGSTVIDLTPTPLKEYAVREFGTADKAILLSSVIGVTLLLAALAGVIARRSFLLAAALLVGLVAVAGAMAMLRPVAERVDLLPAVAAAIVGLSVLWWQVRALAGQPLRPAVPRQARDATSGGTAKPRILLGEDGPYSPMPSRRLVLIGSGIAAALTVAMAASGQAIIRARTAIGNVVLPKPAQPLPPLPEGLEASYRGISRFNTANRDFYRVDTNLTLPVIPLDSWKLTIDGDVGRQFSLSFDELLALPMVERDITLTCVSNEVGGRYVGAARWLGVPLQDLFDLAGGVGDKADQILSTATDGFTISTPLAVALDGRDAMVAVGMNGSPLPAEHGFPARLITPGLYGFVGATKWLSRLTLTTYADKEAYWTKRDWATDAPIKVSARIDTPKPLDTIGSGRTVIGGVAWAQSRGVDKVEVRIDGGPWQETRLGPDAGVDYWRQWYLPWNATPGRHMLAVRATTIDGEVQSAARRSPFPEGSSGIQEIVISVK
jgi:DMSO/TMAO reductase YedYZ molybdopterin-dependent catalytic subunit